MSIPNDHNATAIRYVKNIVAQLKAGGVFIMLSYCSENARLPVLGYKPDPDLQYIALPRALSGSGSHAYAFPSNILACDKELRKE